MISLGFEGHICLLVTFKILESTYTLKKVTDCPFVQICQSSMLACPYGKCKYLRNAFSVPKTGTAAMNQKFKIIESARMCICAISEAVKRVAYVFRLST